MNFEGCINLRDGCLDCLADMNYLTLEVLSVAGCKDLTDRALAKISKRCAALTVLNISGCPNITHEMLIEVLRKSTRVNTLLASGTYISDEGLATLANVLSAKHLTNLDISFCRDISDFGILSLVEKCTNISSLNLCGLNRITDDGARSVCANLWALKSLSLKDIFLLSDSAFWFDRVRDGRPIADESMLTSLTTLNLRDCVNITDRATAGLAERCRRLETLVFRGCEKNTGESLIHLANPCNFKVALCNSLLKLDLSYCPLLTLGPLLDLLTACACLEDLSLDGIMEVNDDFVHQMCLACRTITKLSLQRCQQITDAALCSIADYMWMERVDITQCSRVTDAGIEAFSMV